jgi:hypothetical protein
MGTATFIKSINRIHGASQELFKMEPPIEHYNGLFFDHVMVSGIYVLGEPETFIFGASEDGEVLDWIEMDGSFKGAINIARALNDAGYEVVY